MITRRQVIPPAALALLGLLILVVVLRLGDREPVFEGRKLSAWLDDPALTEAESRRALRALGTNALPQLQSWLERKPGAIERTVRGIDQRMDYLGIGYHPSLTANFRAMRGFLLLGEAAAPAVPWLEAGAARKDADFGFYLSVLAVCGPDGWRALDRLEATDLLEEQKHFMQALALGVRHSPALIPRLAAYLEAPDPAIRREAYVTVRLLRERCPPGLLTALEQRAETEPDDALQKLAREFVTELTGELADGQLTPPPKPESGPIASVPPNPG
jgi:hypothetical protein